MNHAASVGSNRAPGAAPFLCRVLLAIVFLWAGAAKLLAPPEAFADSIDAFRLVPTWFVGPLALALPTFEILTGVALVAERPRRLGAFCAFALAAVFLAALMSAVGRGIAVDCGCFGAGASWLPLTAVQRVWFDLGRDLALLLAALALYRHQLAVRPPAAPP